MEQGRTINATVDVASEQEAPPGPRHAEPQPVDIEAPLAPIQWVPIRSLVAGESPRQDGEDIEHTRMLAKVEERLPPIIVHQSTMRVIDGTHRLGAALLRGDEMIEARLFTGTEQEAFVLAVRANIAHGLPLSLADRTRAAERIIATHPNWSDRAIASVAGLGARTVGNIRRRIEGSSWLVAEGGDVAAGVTGVRARTGRDGRVRPIDNAAGRLRASALLKERPGASLREIAREAHVSPTTVLDVRRRVEQGEDPVPVQYRRNQGRTAERTGDAERMGSQLASILQGLQSDPSLRLTESGRTLLRWIFSRVVRSDERTSIAAKVPPHCAYIIANIARACAEEWTQLADDLERRAVDPARSDPA